MTNKKHDNFQKLKFTKTLSCCEMFCKILRINPKDLPLNAAAGHARVKLNRCLQFMDKLLNLPVDSCRYLTEIFARLFIAGCYMGTGIALQSDELEECADWMLRNKITINTVLRDFLYKVRTAFFEVVIKTMSERYALTLEIRG
jgi:hypothetical protein